MGNGSTAAIFKEGRQIAYYNTMLLIYFFLLKRFRLVIIKLVSISYLQLIVIFYARFVRGKMLKFITFNEIKAEKSAKFDKNLLKVFPKMFKPMVI